MTDASSNRVVWEGRHVGRSFSGHPLEDDCPCEKGECGLAVWGSNPDCPQHGWGAGKTIRQGHNAEDCPGRAIPTRVRMLLRRPFCKHPRNVSYEWDLWRRCVDCGKTRRWK